MQEITPRKSLPVTFFVPGVPRAKQSFRIGANGHHFQPAGLREWQRDVHQVAVMAYHGQPVKAKLYVRLTFSLPDNRRRDVDNLSKAVLDSMNKSIYVDDTQIMHLEVIKMVIPEEPGVLVEVMKQEE